MSEVRGSRCCVVGCPNNFSNSPGTKFYRFSTQKNKRDVRDKWIRAVKRINPDGSPWQPTASSRICSRHFVGNEKSEHPLSPSFIPSIFPSKYGKNQQSEESMTSAKKRFTRMMNKRKREDNAKVIGLGVKIKRSNVELCETEATDYIVEEINTPDPAPEFHDMATQVDFLEEEEDFKLFICNRYSYAKVSEAETQARIPLPSRKKGFASTGKLMIEKGCGENNVYEEVIIDPKTIPSYNTPLECNAGFHGFKSITDDQDMIDLAGVNLKTFQLLLEIPFDSDVQKKIAKENRLLIFLFKMKLGLTFSAIGVLFAVHRTTISRIFYSTLEYMTQACKGFVRWPSKETIRNTMPHNFKEFHPNCRAIIDCTEIKVEQPPEVAQRVYFYSHYKKGFTVKILVACTPNGLISFVSDCFGGRTTDSQITNQSGFLKLLEPGDLILADKGFPEIKTVLDDTGKGILLVMPPFLHNNRFSADEVEETRKIAGVRIHIERIMQRIKTFQIMSKFSISMLPHVNDVVFMTCVLVNMQPHILKCDFRD